MVIVRVKWNLQELSRQTRLAGNRGTTYSNMSIRKIWGKDSRTLQIWCNTESCTLHGLSWHQHTLSCWLPHWTPCVTASPRLSCSPVTNINHFNHLMVMINIQQVQPITSGKAPKQRGTQSTGDRLVDSKLGTRECSFTLTPLFTQQAGQMWCFESRPHPVLPNLHVCYKLNPPSSKLHTQTSS